MVIAPCRVQFNLVGRGVERKSKLSGSSPWVFVKAVSPPKGVNTQFLPSLRQPGLAMLQDVAIKRILAVVVGSLSTLGMGTCNAIDSRTVARLAHTGLEHRCLVRGGSVQGKSEKPVSGCIRQSSLYRGANDDRNTSLHFTGLEVFPQMIRCDRFTIAPYRDLFTDTTSSSVEHMFCPTCGSTIANRSPAYAGKTCFSVFSPRLPGPSVDR